MRIKRPMQQRSGITMILAILVMSAVVAIGITISTVVITQVRINEVVSSTHEGYYAAESGLEQGLHAAKELKPTSTLASALTTIQALTLPDLASGNAIVSENQSFFTAGNTKLQQSANLASSDEVLAEMQENQAVYLEMYDVDDSLNSANSNFNTPELCVYAESGDGATDEALEVTWIAWSKSLETSRSQRVVVHYSEFSNGTACGTQGGKGAIIPLMQFYPAFQPSNAQLAGFRIRITPLKPVGGGSGDVKNFQATISPKPSSQLRLKSVSTGKNQQQALVANIPWTLPLSQLFDFVIFSERSLQKEIELSVSDEVKTFGPYEIEAGIIPGQATLAADGRWRDCNGNAQGWCTTQSSGASFPILCPGTPVQCAPWSWQYRGWQGVHCSADGVSIGAYCDGVAGGASTWLNPVAIGGTSDTQSYDFKCYQTISGVTPNGAKCGFTEYNTQGAYNPNSHKFGVIIPETAFADCTVGPCNYYIRLRGEFNRTLKVNYIENDDVRPTFAFDYDTRNDAGSDALSNNEQSVYPFNSGTASSCILPKPIKVYPGIDTRYLIIRNPNKATETGVGGGYGVCSNNPATLCDADSECGGGLNFCDYTPGNPTFVDSYDILTQPSFLGPEEGYCPTN